MSCHSRVGEMSSSQVGGTLVRRTGSSPALGGYYQFIFLCMGKVKGEEVKLLIVDDEKDRHLVVQKKDGTLYHVEVFEGGGYYTALWLRTPQEIEDARREYEILRKQESEYYQQRQKELEQKKWYQFWK